MGQKEIKKVLEKNNQWMTAREIAEKMNKEVNSQRNPISTPLMKLRNSDPDIYSKQIFTQGKWKYIYIHRRWL